MAEYLIRGETLTGIANKLREARMQTAEDNPITAADIEDEIAADEEYHRQMGHSAGFVEGNRAEHDAFWDAFQQNGTRTDYTNTFGGRGWTTANFRPKYDLRPTISNRMFHYNTIEDLEGHLQSLGITLDTSGVTGSNMQAMFMNSLIVTIPEIDATGVSDIANMFAYCTKLVTIRKLKLRSTGGQTFGTSFRSSANIENITIEGMITKPIDFSSCTKLTHASLMSIINALGAVSTATVCTLGTTNLNKLTAAEKSVATGRGWKLE